MIGMLAGMLGNQGGTGGQGPNPAALMNLLGCLGGGKEGQGLNPAMLTSLLGALGGQNMDLSNLMNMLAGLMGTGAKNSAKSDSSKDKPAAAGDAPNAAGPAKNDRSGEKQAVREVPKIMKWDSLDNRKRMQSK